MIGLLQRVSYASVTVGEKRIGEIGAGLMVLVGVEREDTPAKAERLLQRLLAYRVFSDEQGKMNLSLTETGGGLLLVPQFTLVADTGKGNRPGFSSGASPQLGQELFDYINRAAVEKHAGKVASGEFGADMQVALCNDGPVTFWLQI